VNYSVKKISEIFNLDFIGDGNFIINKVSSINNASENSIIFFSDKKFLSLLKETRSKVVITSKNLTKYCNGNIILSENPYLLFAQISHLIAGKPKLKYGIHKSVNTLTENLNNKICIKPNTIIGNNVVLGDDTFIGSNCFIGNNIIIGSNSYIYSNVVIYDNVKIGNNIIIHSGTVIGSDGFGYVNDKNSWYKIPQIGGVVIGNDVEIGSNTSIDRGTLDNTIIGNGVKIDNQIQIAHNVEIGDNTAIAGCAGIAGSAKIGKNCTIGGGAGIQGHIKICDNTQITGMTKVSCDIKEAGVYSSGTPLMSNAQWLKSAARFKKLNELFLKIKKNK
jgi:UDP-3-O-[3-hydroxymyristoyl] glucosamine N-acyltransferase